MTVCPTEEEIMTRRTPSEELDIIESIVSEHPSGIGIAALERKLEQGLGW